MIADVPDPGWRTIQLGEILTGAQMCKVLEILQELEYRKRIDLLKEFAHSIEDQLDKKGLLPEFFAYWLEFTHIKGDL